MVNNRSGKFYRNNEKQIMQSLGLEPTPNSGRRFDWVIKRKREEEEIMDIQ